MKWTTLTTGPKIMQNEERKETHYQPKFLTFMFTNRCSCIKGDQKELHKDDGVQFKKWTKYKMDCQRTEVWLKTQHRVTPSWRETASQRERDRTTLVKLLHFLEMGKRHTSQSSVMWANSMPCSSISCFLRLVRLIKSVREKAFPPQDSSSLIR